MRTAILIDDALRILDSSTVDVLKEDLGIPNLQVGGKPVSEQSVSVIRIPRRMCVINGNLRLKPKMLSFSFKQLKDAAVDRIVLRSMWQTAYHLANQENSAAA